MKRRVRKRLKSICFHLRLHSVEQTKNFVTMTDVTTNIDQDQVWALGDQCLTTTNQWVESLPWVDTANKILYN